MDAEDLKLEVDKLHDEQEGKPTGEPDLAKIEAEVAALKALAAQGKAAEAVEGLLNLEKQQRLAEDVGGTKLACLAVLEVCALGERRGAGRGRGQERGRARTGRGGRGG